MTKCLEWKGSLDTGGYGLKRVEGKLWKRHRLEWTVIKGDIPEGMFVCHTCDNPRCYNIEHLFLGTNSDNMKDMYRKERGNNFFKDNNPKRKLTKEQVVIIKEKRSLNETQQSVADFFGVDRTLISQIDRGIIYANN